MLYTYDVHEVLSLVIVSSLSLLSLLLLQLVSASVIGLSSVVISG